MYILIKDFQYTNQEKQIMTLSVGTKLEVETNGFFHFKLKGKEYRVEKVIVVNNPEFFKKVDFLSLLIDLLKREKKKTAPKLAESIEQLVLDEVLADNTLVNPNTEMIMVKACYKMYVSTKNEEYLEPLTELGYYWDEKGVYKD
jgi:hypothetical protein